MRRNPVFVLPAVILAAHLASPLNSVWAVNLEAFEFSDANGTDLTAAVNSVNAGNNWTSSMTNGISDMSPSRVNAGAYQIIKESDGLATNHLQMANVSSGSVYLVAEMASWAFREDLATEPEEEVRFAFLNEDTGTSGNTITAEMIIRRGASGGIELAGRALGAGSSFIAGTAPLSNDQTQRFTTVLALNLDNDSYKVYYKDGTSPSQFLGQGAVSPLRSANSVRMAANNFFGNGNFFPVLFEEQFNIDRIAVSTTNPLTDLVTVTIDRGTGALTLLNNTGQALPGLLSYSIDSPAGGLDATGWKTIAGNYDLAGDDSVDSTGNWSIDSSLPTQLSESANSASGGQLAIGQSVVLNKTNDAVWLQSPFEDVTMTLNFSGGLSRSADVVFTGNGGNRFELGDLNFDGVVTAADWTTMITFNETSLAGLSLVEAYRRGDLDGDGVNSIVDIGLFKEAFNAQNGLGAFEAMIAGAPEPGALSLVCGAVLLPLLRRRLAALMLLAVVSLSVARPGQAAILEDFPFNDVNTALLNEAENVVNVGNAWNEDTADMSGSQVLNGVYRIQKNNDNFGTNYLDIANVSSGTIWLVAEMAGWNYSSLVGQGEFDSGELEEIRFSFLNNDGNQQGGSTYAAQVEINRTSSGGLEILGDALGTGGQPIAASPLSLTQSEPFTVVLEYDTTNDDYTIYTKSGASPFSVVGTANTSTTRNANSIRFVANNNFGGTGEFFDIDRLYLTDVSPIVDTVDPLTLRVNTTTGQTWIVNASSESYSFDSYRITSSTNSLLPTDGNWSSLSDQAIDAVDGDDIDSIVGNGIGETWDEAGGSSSGVLAESFLLGSSTLAPTEMLSLGRAVASGGSPALEFSYRRADTGAVITGLLEFVEGGLAGDFNNDGSVDAADYTVWRDGLGTTFTPADYVVWRSNYGQSASLMDSATPAPEPAAWALAIFVLPWLNRSRRYTTSE